MEKKSIREKIIEEASQYIWGRIKFIFLMIVLIIGVKNHPGLDTFFTIMIILQIVLSISYVLKLPKKILEAEKKEKNNNYYDHYRRRTNYQNSRISFTNDITTSAKLLGINIIQDDEDTIKKKYRKLAMKWHPDRFATDIPENQEIAKKNFQKISSAYEKIKQYKNIN
jgi:hypothetical protein